jgi:hypothetical protein
MTEGNKLGREWGCQEYGSFEKKDKPEDGNQSKLEKGSFFFGMNRLPQ